MLVVDLRSLGAILHRIATGADPGKGEPAPANAWRGIDQRWHDLTMRMIRARPGIPLQALRDEVHELRPAASRWQETAVGGGRRRGTHRRGGGVGVSESAGVVRFAGGLCRGAGNLRDLNGALADPQRQVLPAELRWMACMPELDEIRKSAPFGLPAVSPAAMGKVRDAERQFKVARAAAGSLGGRAIN